MHHRVYVNLAGDSPPFREHLSRIIDPTRDEEGRSPLLPLLRDDGWWSDLSPADIEAITRALASARGHYGRPGQLAGSEQECARIAAAAHRYFVMRAQEVVLGPDRVRELETALRNLCDELHRSSPPTTAPLNQRYQEAREALG